MKKFIRSVSNLELSSIKQNGITILYATLVELVGQRRLLCDSQMPLCLKEHFPNRGVRLALL